MKRRIKRLGIGLLCLLMICVIGFRIYVNDYYRAGTEAQHALVHAEETPAGTVFAPSGQTDTALIFYPGGKVESTAYAPLMEACAEKGILCILLDVKDHLAILDVNAADGIQEMYPEIEHWYLAGHSLGGTCAGLYLEEHQDEYEGLILLAAYITKDLSQSDLKVLQIYGTEDGVLNRERMAEDAVNLPEDTQIRVIEGGNHAGFGDYGEQEKDGEAKISSAEQVRITAEWIDEFR